MILVSRRRPAGLFAAATFAATAGMAIAQSGAKTDTSHVKAVFTQMGVPVEGRFSRFDASVEFDPAEPATAKARVVIDTGSFELGPGAEAYAAETRRPEWFDVAHYPQAVFEATGATPIAPGRYEFAGRLEMKGHGADLRGPFTVARSDGKSVFEGEVPISRLAFDIGDGEWRDTSILADEVLVRFRIVVAAPFAGASADTYRIDPAHTYPSFAADHMGISWFRGKFEKTTGTIELDRQAKTGRIEVVIDAASIDIGHEKLNQHLRGADFFDVEMFPEIRFTGSDFRFEGDVPVAVSGKLEMRGEARPVELKLESFTCREHPMLKREVCGAEATAVIDRGDWGMTYGAPPSTSEVRLAIQVEAAKQ